MSREGVALPGTGAPSQEYDRMNEAQYRAAVEQALGRLSAAIREIEELSDDLTITGAWTFDPGPVVVGTDPGGSSKLRVGGSLRLDANVVVEDGGKVQISNLATNMTSDNHISIFDSNGDARLFVGEDVDHWIELAWDTSANQARIRIDDGVTVHTPILLPDTGNIIMPNLPTSDPAVANALWNDSGTLKVSSG